MALSEGHTNEAYEDVELQEDPVTNLDSNGIKKVIDEPVHDGPYAVIDRYSNNSSSKSSKTIHAPNCTFNDKGSLSKVKDINSWKAIDKMSESVGQMSSSYDAYDQLDSKNKSGENTYVTLATEETGGNSAENKISDGQRDSTEEPGEKTEKAARNKMTEPGAETKTAVEAVEENEEHIYLTLEPSETDGHDRNYEIQGAEEPANLTDEPVEIGKHVENGMSESVPKDKAIEAADDNKLPEIQGQKGATNEAVETTEEDAKNKIMETGGGHVNPAFDSDDTVEETTKNRMGPALGTGGSTAAFDTNKKEDNSRTTDLHTMIEFYESAGPDGPYAGMRKEDVIKYSSTPFWRALRYTCLIVIVAGWLAMLGASIGLIVVSPKCLPWWQTSVVYQIYPRSFMDSDGDGIGDLQGIENKLEYLSGLGVGAILINSIYSSSQQDLGYDVTNLQEVDEIFGTQQIFESLASAAHDKGIKVILDFVPNQASLQSEHFNKSQNFAGNEEYKDYFIWSESANNWVSAYAGPAWTLDETRNEYYLHQFSKYQPDYNLRNEQVQKYLEDSLDKWFVAGVDGFSIQASRYLYEDPNFTNDPTNDAFTGTLDPKQYESLLHDYSAEFDSAQHDLLRGWHEGVFYQYSTAGTYRVMLTDSNSNVTYAKTYYGTNSDPMADLPMNFNLLKLGDQDGLGGYANGNDIEFLVKEWLTDLPPGKWPNFQLGNHEVRRITSRLSPTYTKAANMLLLTLPGTPICYYGDELGMQDIDIASYDDVVDIKGKMDEPNWKTKTRDPQRAPMQWTNGANAGFSDQYATTWLPIHPDYTINNVETQESTEDSPLNLFKALTTLRSENRAFLSEAITFVYSSNSIIAYVRESDEQERKFLVAINFGTVYLETDLFQENNNLPIEGSVVVASNPSRVGNRVQLNKLGLSAGEGIVIRLDVVVNVGSNYWFEYFRQT